MLDNRYHINFWNYVPAELQDKDTVKLMSELGFTSIMTGGIPVMADDNYKKKIAEVLDECDKRGITAIVSDGRFKMFHMRSNGEEQYRKDIREATEFYKQFPAAKYALVFDEPRTEDWPWLFRAFQIMHEETHLQPFSALFHGRGMEENSVYKELNEYIDKTNTKLLLYNCYSQVFREEEEKIQGLNNFFRNLRLHAEIAQKKEVTLCVSLACVAHWNFRSVTQDDIRWQLNTSAAHGVKGFYWYYPFGRKTQKSSFVDHPVDMYGDKTPYFYPLSFENKYFMEFTASKLKSYTLEKVYHDFTAYGGYPLFEEDKDEIISNVHNEYHRPLIVSRFKNAEGKNLIMIVNNSQRDVAHVKVTLKPAFDTGHRRQWIAPGGAIFIDC